MSLEAAVAANTKALEALTAAFLAGAALPSERMKAAIEKSLTDKPPVVVKSPAKDPVAAPAGNLDYERDVKPKALAVAAKHGRDKLVGILATFKLTQTNLAKPEQFADLVKAFDEVLA